jgi:glycine oxidase
MSQDRIVIVGAGLLGLALASELRRRNFAVTLLERAVPGAEASTAAAGILGPQLEHDDDGPTLALGVAGVRATLDLARTLRSEVNADVDLVEHGAIKAAFDDHDARALERRVAWQKSCGLRVDLVSGAEARAVLPQLGDGVVRAAVFPDDHCLDPRAYGRGLHALALSRGVDVRMGIPVARLMTSSERVSGVVLEDGSRVEAEHVIVCAGAWSSRVPDVAKLAGLDDELSVLGADGAFVFPVRGQIVELASGEAPLTRVVYGAGAYCVPRGDGRVVCGSTTEHAGFDKSVTAAGVHALLSRVLRALPSLGARTLNATWAGLRPATKDGLPLLGETKTPGLWLSTGHYRNGVLLAAISAEVVASLVCGQRPCVDVAPFSPKRLRSPST